MRRVQVQRTAGAKRVPERPGRAARGSPEGLVLALQRSIGNRATARILSRETRTIHGEDVNVASDKEANEADEIIARIASTYGITIDSGKLVTATRERYSKAPASELMKVKQRNWNLRELRAVEKACAHYAPILGKARSTSAREDDDQEVTAFGKATLSIDTNTATGVAHDRTAGEYFRPRAAAGIYASAEHDTTFAYTDVDKNLEWICTHELAHGLMDYVVEDFREAAGYWKDSSTKTGSGEYPFTRYSTSALSEDLAESTAAYFMKGAVFGKTCPKRFLVIDAAVKAWTSGHEDEEARQRELRQIEQEQEEQSGAGQGSRSG